MTDPNRARQLLMDERARLYQLLKDADLSSVGREDETESLSELSDLDQHPAEVGTETFNRERDLSLLESVEGQLADVEAALGRIDDGTYGVCMACGKKITADRLEAVPATPFCLEDAERASAESGRR